MGWAQVHVGGSCSDAGWKERHKHSGGAQLLRCKLQLFATVPRNPPARKFVH